MTRDFSNIRKHVQFGSGLVMAAFITGHFTDHALGIISMHAMESFRRTLQVLWRSPAGTILLYGALVLHFVLAVDSLIRRRTWRMPLLELVKVSTGLLLPLLISAHVISTRVEYQLTGFDAGYPVVLSRMLQSPTAQIRQVLALGIAWLHACLGIWYSIRNREWYSRLHLLVYSVMLLVPMLAVIGIAQGFKQVRLASPRIDLAPPPRDIADLLAGINLSVVLVTVGGLLLATIIHFMPRHGRIRIRYANGVTVAVPKGTSVLEASRMHNLPHLSVCGSRGRCSTCRIAVSGDVSKHAPPSALEQETLNRIGARSNVRLACQFRPLADVDVDILLDASQGGQINQAENSQMVSHERMVAVLFVDLRQFTTLSQEVLPFDAVHILNRFFELLGTAAEKSGGQVDNFIGDGALLLFGLETDFQSACRQALSAMSLISAGIRELNVSMERDLKRSLRIAAGLHGGPAVIGRVGYRSFSQLTVVGDTVNVASRLEGVAKDEDAELAVSADVLKGAGVELRKNEPRALQLRGRMDSVTVHVFKTADLLQLAQ